MVFEDTYMMIDSTDGPDWAKLLRNKMNEHRPDESIDERSGLLNV